MSELISSDTNEDPGFLSEQIITYIGNKRSLLPFIGSGVEHVKKRLDKQKLTTLDLFSGSGIVARYFKQHSSHVIANDLEEYSQIANSCYLTNKSDIDRADLILRIEAMKGRILENLAPGFITRLYSPRDENNISPHDRVFYTARNAMYLDTARQLISAEPEVLQPYFLAPLLSEASVHANTSGVFKGFYKADGKGQFGGAGRNALSRILGEIELKMPVFSRFESTFEVHRKEAHELANTLPEVDMAYLDPPYNQHPYGSNYFMLNLLVNYAEPEHISKVSGIPRSWNKSAYNVKSAAARSLFDLVRDCRAKFILISYNSEGFINKKEFLSVLKQLGKVVSLETKYNTFRGSRNLVKRATYVKEYLFLLEKK